MSVKSEHNKTNTLIKNNIRAPIAILECMEEGMLSSESSMATNPMSRQVSLSYPAAMRYRNLGKSGLRISAIGLGTWVTFGSHISEQMAEDIVSVAYENGINLFDTADVYAGGKSEVLLGRILKKKEWKRSTYNVATKLFWGTRSETDRGLSRKYIIEGLQASLERLQLSYVDIIFVNKADPMCPMEEVVRAFTHCINQGMAMYWGTSRWTAMEIMSIAENIPHMFNLCQIGLLVNMVNHLMVNMPVVLCSPREVLLFVNFPMNEAYTVARQFNLIPPLVEQTEYHMFQREKVEIHLPELYHKIGIGTMTWSPQAFGMYSGKFDEGVHLLSRGSIKVRNFTVVQDKTCPEEGRSPRHQSKLQELSLLAEKVGCTSTQLTIAWCLKNENVHCVLVGASTPEQLYENLNALQFLPRLTTGLINEIEMILDNKPVRMPLQR